MFVTYFKIAIFTSFPEMIMITLLGLQLTNIRCTSIRKVLLVSFVQAMVALFIMIFDLNIAFSSITQIISMIILISIILNIKYFKSVIVVLVGVLLQGIIQSIILPIISSLREVQINNLTYNFQEAIICFIPVFIISIIILIVSRKKQLYLLDINS